MMLSSQNMGVKLIFSYGVIVIFFLFSLFLAIATIDAFITNDLVEAVVDDVSFIRKSFSVSFTIKTNGSEEKFTNVGLFSPTRIESEIVAVYRGHIYSFLKPMIIENLVIWLISALICLAFLVIRVVYMVQTRSNPGAV